PPKKGRPHVLRVIRELLYYKPESRKTSISSAIEYLGKVLKKRAVVFLMSDFMDTGYEKLLGILNKRHDIISISISDPREKDMPDMGLVKFEDAETGEILYLDTGDDLLKKELAKKRSAFLDNRNRAFRSIGLDSIDIFTDKPYIGPLIIFFRMRAKRFR
ncbi:MAG: VWA domain-containing protein, partial [Candidatus Omnitrophota bacterium]|nr:VWA domain-containing protein [Candidatus Omnitrophota bacterium]